MSSALGAGVMSIMHSVRRDPMRSLRRNLYRVGTSSRPYIETDYFARCHAPSCTVSIEGAFVAELHPKRGQVDVMMLILPPILDQTLQS
jgi:hypothetical protein